MTNPGSYALPYNGEAPPPMQMMEMLYGALATQMISVAAELGIADQLADGPKPVAEIATDDSRRREMGIAARAKAVTDFDEQRCIDLTLDVYGSLLERTRAGAAA